MHLLGLGYIDWPMSFWVPPTFFSPVQGLQRVIVSTYLHGYWGSNTGLHVCETSTLLGEPYTQLLFSVCLMLQCLQPSRLRRVHLSERTFQRQQRALQEQAFHLQSTFPTTLVKISDTKTKLPFPTSTYNPRQGTMQPVCASKLHIIVQTSQIPSLPCLSHTKYSQGCELVFPFTSFCHLKHKKLLGMGLHPPLAKVREEEIH